MKNSFFFNERLKKSQNGDKVLLCKALPSLDYPYIPILFIDYKEVLLTTLSTSYINYQGLLYCLQKKNSCSDSKKKNSQFKKKILNTGNSRLKEKILNSKRKLLA